MDKIERNKVTRDQIDRFFASYFPNWRLQQILTVEKILDNKFSFYAGIIEDTKQYDDSNGEATIAQEVTNGLLFEAISVCIQSIEDLFALLSAGENRDYFIKNIITYSAGRIENFIKQERSDVKLCALFWVPYFKGTLSNPDMDQIYRDGIQLLVEMTQRLRAFYGQYHFFYTQYKHGLTVALRPFKKYSYEQIVDSKMGEMDPYLAAFDNLSLIKLESKQDRQTEMAFMPCFTNNIIPHLNELMQEDNLIRYTFPPIKTNINDLKNISYMVRDCIDIFRNNILQTVYDTPPYKMRIPSRDRGKVFQFEMAELS